MKTMMDRVATVMGGLMLAGVALSPALAQQLTVTSTKLPAGQGNPYVATGGIDLSHLFAFFDPLFTVDGATGGVVPALGLSYQNKSPTLWEIKLRPNVKFINGRPLDAEAIATVINYLGTDEGKTSQMAREIKYIKSARAVDPLTLEVETAQPNPTMMREFSFSVFGDHKAFLDMGAAAFARNPVGSGPFKVTSWTAERVSSTANTDSWRKPQVEGLNFVSLPDKTTRVQALLSNQVQIAIYLGFDDRKTLEDRGFDFVVTPGDAVHVIRYNMFEDSPLKDIRVRQALNYGTNRKSLVDNLLGGLVKQGSQPARSGTSGHDPSIAPYAFDPSKAKALLTEAGYPNGFNIVSEVYASEADNRDAFNQVGQDLAKIGVKVEFVEIQLPDMVSKALGRAPYKSAMTNIYYRAGYQMDGMRPVNTLGNACGAIKFWCDEAITPIINAANQEFDDKKREALAHQVMKRYHDQAAALFLYEDYNIYAKTKNVNVKPFRAGIDAPWHTVTFSK